MSATPNAPAPGQTEHPQQQPESPGGYIHRVCIQCNNVFRVPADKFDVKQCPNCHKG